MVNNLKLTANQLVHTTQKYEKQRTGNFLLEDTLGTTLVLHGNLNQPLEINGIGVSDKAIVIILPSGRILNQLLLKLNLRRDNKC